MVVTPSPTKSPPASVPDIPRSNVQIDQIAPEPQTVVPTHISMPSLSIAMDISPVGVDAQGGLVIPSDSNEAGWYQFGPGMFEQAGSIVLAAHIDSWNGIGPFSRIKDASAGSPVILTGGGRSESFAVTEVQQTAKAGEAMSGIFEKKGPPRLVMVTCGGLFNSTTGHYADNVILIATRTAP